MKISNYKVKIQEEEKIREYYRLEKGLFGLITFDIVDRIEKRGKAVSIFIPMLHKDDEVFINGERVFCNNTRDLP